ncbi:hypothetical protein ACFLWU_04855 [Chloroflexota bacterium]
MSDQLFQKIKPGTIPFPQMWCQKTDTNIWPIPEGLWLRDKKDEYFARIMYLSMALLELPEAREDLKVCIGQFEAEFAPQYVNSFKRFITQVSQVKNQQLYVQLWKQHNTKLNKNILDRQSELLAIYQPWSNKWALESIWMTAWVFAERFYSIITQSLGIDPGFYKKEMLTSRGELARTMVSNSYPELNEEYKVLLDPHRPKSEKRQRKEAREEFQEREYYRKRDGELITAAKWWVIVRILRYQESKFVNFDIPKFDNGSGGIALSNFSRLKLAPYDEAISFIPKMGRPCKTE